MVTAKDCLARYGDPSHEKNMTLWDVPAELEIGVIPKRVYCNEDLIPPLTQAFKNLISTGYVKELKTWDGCFNIRNVRGRTSQSLHSWGIAIDINASWNQLGKKPTMTEGFIKCFTDAGFDWGGTWQRKDGMHFQIATLP
jgi:hypothetical protein